MSLSFSRWNSRGWDVLLKLVLLLGYLLFGEADSVALRPLYAEILSTHALELRHEFVLDE